VVRDIVEHLGSGPVLGDGGYLIELERRGYVRPGLWLPTVVLDHPQALLELHREFIRAGSEVLQALTFYGTRDILETSAGRGREAEVLNRAAVALARQAAGDRALVAGTVCHTGALDPKNPLPGFGPAAPGALEHARSLLREQIGWLASAGVDLIIAETFFRLDEAVAAVEAATAAGLPSIASVSIRADPATDDGFSAAACATRLKAAGAAAVGLNCERDPERMLPLLQAMRDAVDGPIAAQPVGLRTAAGPAFAGGAATREARQLSRREWGEFAQQAVDLGIRYLGACCGTGPSGIRGMAEALHKPTWLTGRC
jgi:betaine-homocysteine S-methyltransferase